MADAKKVARRREYDLRIIEPDKSLRACPFCGHPKADLQEHTDILTGRETYCVVCWGCAAIGPWDKTASGAIRGWNGYGQEG